jgi:hypothetical protein
MEVVMITVPDLLNHRHSRAVPVSKCTWLSIVLPKSRVGFQMIDVNVMNLLTDISGFSVRKLTKPKIDAEVDVYYLQYEDAIFAIAFVEVVPYEYMVRSITLDPTLELELQLQMQVTANVHHSRQVRVGYDILDNIDLTNWLQRGGTTGRPYRGGKGYDCYIQYLNGATQKDLRARYGGDVFDVINLFAKRVGGVTFYRGKQIAETERVSSLEKAYAWLQNNPDHFTTTRLH